MLRVRTVTIVLLVCYIQIADLSGWFPQQRAIAKTRSSNNVGEAQRWQYCAITRAYTEAPEKGDRATGTIEICFFKESGCDVTKVKAEVTYAEVKAASDAAIAAAIAAGGTPWKPSESNIRTLAGQKARSIAMARAITNLGANEWEMIGEHPFDLDLGYNLKATYFKRAM